MYMCLPGGVEDLAAGTIDRHGQDHMVEEVRGTTMTAPAATLIGGDTDQSLIWRLTDRITC